MAAMLTKAVVHQLIMLLIPLFLALRLNDFYPLLGKLLVGLRVYMPPTLPELAQFSASAREAMSRKSSKKRSQQQQQIEDFRVPRDAPIRLRAELMTHNDVNALSLSDDATQLMVCLAATLGTWFVTEGVCFYRNTPTTTPSAAFFLSIIGLGVFVQKLVALISHFRGFELSLALASGAISALGSLLCLSTKEGGPFVFALDSTLTDAGARIRTMATAVGMEAPLPEDGGQRALAFSKVAMGIVCGAGTTLCFFSAWRIGTSYTEALSSATGSPLRRALLHADFFWPALVSALCIRPLYLAAGVPASQWGCWLCLALGVQSVLRLCALRPHLQAYLDRAYAYVLALPSGAEKLISARTIGSRIGTIYRYFGVVVLQLLASAGWVFCLFVVLKLRGGVSWDPRMPPSAGGEYDLFTPDVYREVLGFVAWWLSSAYFVLSASALLASRYSSGPKK